MTFTPGWLYVLRSLALRTIDFFKTLSAPIQRTLSAGIHTIAVRKPNNEPILYIGSGTYVEGGVQCRLLSYRGSTTTNATQHWIAKYHSAGYTITATGLLGWTAIRVPTWLPSARIRMVAIEAVLTFISYAAKEFKMDEIFTINLPWVRKNVAWKPLCTHTAIIKLPHGTHLDMMDEQLEVYNRDRKKHARKRKDE